MGRKGVVLQVITLLIASYLGTAVSANIKIDKEINENKNLDVVITENTLDIRKRFLWEHYNVQNGKGASQKTYTSH